MKKKKKKLKRRRRRRRRRFVFIDQVAPVLLESKHLLPVTMKISSFSKKKKEKKKKENSFDMHASR